MVVKFKVAGKILRCPTTTGHPLVKSSGGWTIRLTQDHLLCNEMSKDEMNDMNTLHY